MTTYFAGDPRSNRERMLAGELYIADDPDSLRIAHRARVLSEKFHQLSLADVDTPERALTVLEELLGGFGKDSYIRSPLTVDYGENIYIGERVFINANFTALDVARIEIGDDCLIGPNVQLLTPTHPLDPAPRRDKLEAAQPITLGANVWLGGGVIVCPGVTIGDNTVVGAGAIVTKNLPANVVAVGNPARVIKQIV